MSDNPQNEDPRLAAMKRMSAALLVLETRQAALSAVVIDALEKLGYQPLDYPDIRTFLSHLEMKRCREFLATHADDDPALASELKRIIDQTQ
jgi:hypothetical protein